MIFNTFELFHNITSKTFLESFTKITFLFNITMVDKWAEWYFPQWYPKGKCVILNHPALRHLKHHRHKQPSTCDLCTCVAVHIWFILYILSEYAHSKHLIHKHYTSHCISILSTPAVQHPCALRALEGGRFMPIFPDGTAKLAVGTVPLMYSGIWTLSPESSCFSKKEPCIKASTSTCHPQPLLFIGSVLCFSPRWIVIHKPPLHTLH